MYFGHIVKTEIDEEIYDHPIQPYAQTLLYVVPVTNLKHVVTNRIVLEGYVPSPSNPPSECTFRTRCWKVQDVYAGEVPALKDRFNQGHRNACYFVEETRAF